MILNKRVLVVDLDETLYSINTFHHFLKYLIRYSFQNFKLSLLIMLCWYSCLRLLSFITHSRFKFFVLNQIKNQSIDYENFVTIISKHKVHFEALTDPIFTTKILATAAPSCYAKIIAKRGGFDVCLATDFPELVYDSSFENIREVKKENLVNYLKTHDLGVVDVFITDHLDDAPIIKIAKQNLIVNPNDEFFYFLKHNSINFEVCKT